VVAIAEMETGDPHGRNRSLLKAANPAAEAAAGVEVAAQTIHVTSTKLQR
jgi:hypothetical protein